VRCDEQEILLSRHMRRSGQGSRGSDIGGEVKKELYDMREGGKEGKESKESKEVEK
jgi:hypothetical protein